MPIPANPTLSDIDAAARATHLAVRGAAHSDEGTVVLLGPDEPAFWQAFTASNEYLDGAPHPLDRWSARVIGVLADECGASAAFPYDGPPYPPFLDWAARSNAAWSSPTGLLVHHDAGLFISYRGALIFDHLLALPAPASNPCDTCETRPCETACPVGALRPDAPYGVATCRVHVAGPYGTECRDRGCLVRRACPVSQKFGRDEAQSAFHMAAFV